MKKSMIYLLVTCISLICINNIFANIETASIEAEALNVDESDLIVIKELIAAELSKRDIVITEKKAGITYHLKAMKIGTKIILTLTKKITEQNTIISSKKSKCKIY